MVGWFARVNSLFSGILNLPIRQRIAGISRKVARTSVCSAGLDLIGPYLENRKEYLLSVVKPLQERKENVYVLPGSPDRCG
jgi:hypothetical protein